MRPEREPVAVSCHERAASFSAQAHVSWYVPRSSATPSGTSTGIGEVKLIVSPGAASSSITAGRSVPSQ